MHSHAGTDPSVAIVIPAYNAESHIERVLRAAVAAAGGARILVVDPGSDDRTPEIVESMGIELLRLGRRAGPAEARNEGVALLDEDVVLFIDSDCEPHLDVVKRVLETFASDPTIVSLTGSYDDSPPDPGFFSGYMNLRHHFTHQNASRENASFWAGCGAIRRSTFLEIGGFDARQFPMPQIEDIELGTRLSGRGRTLLDPDLQVKHLKRWTFRNVVWTDIFQRAVPWSRLIHRMGELPNDLNLRLSQRIAAAIAPLVLLSLVALPVAALAGQSGVAVLAALVIAASLGLHWPMIRSFTAARGPLFALGGWVFQQVHLIYSAVTFVICRLIG